MQTFLDGPAGRIQLLIETPDGAPRGVAMLSHPQPLLGGSPQHPLTRAQARRLLALGWIVARPSFRGVDGSEGTYDEGVSEADDAVLIAGELRARHPGLPLALVGFSFGAHVYARAACMLETTTPADAIVLLGLPIGATPGGRAYEALPIPARTLLLHGELDTMAPLAPVLEWGRASHHPVTVFPGTNHFFKGCLEQALEAMVAPLQALA